MEERDDDVQLKAWGDYFTPECLAEIFNKCCERYTDGPHLEEARSNMEHHEAWMRATHPDPLPLEEILRIAYENESAALGMSNLPVVTMFRMPTFLESFPYGFRMSQRYFIEDIRSGRKPA